MTCPQCEYTKSPSHQKCANCGVAFPKPEYSFLLAHCEVFNNHRSR